MRAGTELYPVSVHVIQPVNSLNVRRVFSIRASDAGDRVSRRAESKQISAQ